jgi:hypothetical protein
MLFPSGRLGATRNPSCHKPPRLPLPATLLPELSLGSGRGASKVGGGRAPLCHDAERLSGAHGVAASGARAVGQEVHGGTATWPTDTPEAGQRCCDVVGPSPVFSVWLKFGWTTAVFGPWTGRVPPRLRLAVCGSVGGAGRLNPVGGGRWRVLGSQI